MSHTHYEYQCKPVRTSTCRKIISTVVLFCFCIMTLRQSFAMTNQENDPINDFPILRNSTSFQTPPCHDMLSLDKPIPVIPNKRNPIHFSNLSHLLVGALCFSAWVKKACAVNINLANLGSSGITITGTTSSQTGYSVSGAGDVNGDGYADMLIGAPNGNSYAGIAYLIYGNSSSLVNIDLLDNLGSSGITITATTSSQTGYSVSGAGDVNGDGYADMLIGAPNAGIAYLIYGNSSLKNIDLANPLGTSGITITATTGSGTGYSVSGAGDVNRDGYADMLIGAPNYGYGANAGTVFLIYGNSSLANINLANPLGTSGITIICANSLNTIGKSVSGAGDVNRDGYADMLIGQPQYSSNIGRAYLIYGGSGLANINLANLKTSGVIFTGSGDGGIYGSELGYSVSGAGDVNGDGYADMLLGAPNYGGSNGHYATGEARLIYGSRENIEGYLSITGGSKSYTGWSVSSAGDVNRDGYDDMLVGAYGDDIAYLIYGNSSLVSLGSSGIITITGKSASQAGWSVSGAGDVNGDGYADMLIGAPNGNSGAGIAYLIYGSGQLTDQPSSQPSGQPTDQPSKQPTNQPSKQSTNKTSSTLPNTLYIVTPIVAFFVGMPLIVLTARYINGIYKNKAANLDTENQSTTEGLLNPIADL